MSTTFELNKEACNVNEDEEFSEEFIKYICEKLAESEAEAANPNTRWYTHEEIFGHLREKYGYKI